jgi:hypothetical protein
MTLVELDQNLKIRNRVAVGKEVKSDTVQCREKRLAYFLADDAQARRQYYRLSDEGLTKAPLLSDEFETKAGCHDSMILKTANGERLRKWGSPSPLFESAGIEFLAPRAEEEQIHWIISTPLKEFHQSELYDLQSEAAEPVLTGLLMSPEKSDDSEPSSVGLGHVISVGQDRLLWLSQK